MASIQFDVGQANWTAKTTGIPSGRFSGGRLDGARNDISTAYVAGGGALCDALTVSKTTNGGTSWSPVLITATNGQRRHRLARGRRRSWLVVRRIRAGFRSRPRRFNPRRLHRSGIRPPHHQRRNNLATGVRQPLRSKRPKWSANITQHKNYRGVGLEDTSALWLELLSDARAPLKPATLTSSACAKNRDGKGVKVIPQRQNPAGKTRSTTSRRTSLTARFMPPVRAFTTSIKARNFTDATDQPRRQHGPNSFLNRQWRNLEHDAQFRDTGDLGRG